MTIRILIADDQSLVLTGLRTILQAEADMEVAGEARDGDQAVRLAAELTPDVVLLDIRMPGMDGITATRLILAAGGPRVIILTTFDLDEYVYQALRAGASGFLVKDIPDDQLVAGIRQVMRGDTLLAPSVTRRLIETYTRRPPSAGQLPAAGTLTPRETEVWQLMARGLTNTEIATQLFVGEATVKTHVSRVMTKLGARDRIQAVVLAYENDMAKRALQAGGRFGGPGACGPVRRFTDDAPDDEQPRLGAWLELRADDPAAVLRAALDAGLTEVKHPGHPYYFMVPGGQVFTIAPTS